METKWDWEDVGDGQFLIYALDDHMDVVEIAYANEESARDTILAAHNRLAIAEQQAQTLRAALSEIRTVVASHLASHAEHGPLPRAVSRIADAALNPQSVGASDE